MSTIASGAASAASHLHTRGILHGDLYGHNLLVDSRGQTLLSDFGAASFFDPNTSQGQALQRLETRAFGCLLEDLLERSHARGQEERLTALIALQRQCMLEDPSQRPAFNQLVEQLEQYDVATERFGQVVA